MRIVSLDLSLTRTGYAFSNGGFPRAGVLVPPKTAASGMARLSWIRARVSALVLRGVPLADPAGYQEDADLVLIEGYSFGQARGSSHSHALGELGGVVRLLLHERGIPYIDVAPAVLKKFATGRGNAKKEEVLGAAIRRLEYEGSDHNEADALFLLHAALVHFDRCPVAFPQAQVAALEGISWPVLERKAVA